MFFLNQPLLLLKFAFKKYTSGRGFIFCEPVKISMIILVVWAATKPAPTDICGDGRCGFSINLEGISAHMCYLIILDMEKEASYFKKNSKGYGLTLSSS